MINRKVKIGVIGGGSWATALVKILSKNERKVGWYMRNKKNIRYIRRNKHQINNLSSATLPSRKLMMHHDINKIVANSEVLIFAIPSAFLASELEKLKHSLEGKMIWSAIKGIVPETGLIVGEHLKKYQNVSFENFGVIAGPCHAEEVAMERLSYLTLCSENTAQAEYLKLSMQQDYIACSISNDYIGAEYGAVLKNIYAIAAGIAHGLGYGDNFQAVLISNAIREMNRFVKKIHKTKRNINASAYLGDLLVTSYSTFSRNRMFGTMLGKGYTVKAAMMEMNMVAEGYYAVKSAYKIASKKTPIITAVYDIVYNGMNTNEVINRLTNQFD